MGLASYASIVDASGAPVFVRFSISSEEEAMMSQCRSEGAKHLWNRLESSRENEDPNGMSLRGRSCADTSLSQVFFMRPSDTVFSCLALESRAMTALLVEDASNKH